MIHQEHPGVGSLDISAFCNEKNNREIRLSVALRLPKREKRAQRVCGKLHRLIAVERPERPLRCGGRSSRAFVFFIHRPPPLGGGGGHVRWARF